MPIEEKKKSFGILFNLVVAQRHWRLCNALEAQECALAILFSKKNLEHRGILEFAYFFLTWSSLQML